METHTPPFVTLVIPAFNEAEAIGPAIRKVVDDLASAVEEVIVVDDGSSDETGRICEEAGVTVIRHSANRGYGAALKTGIRAAKGKYILTMDADGQHRVEDALALIERGRQEPTDLIVGQREALLHSPLWRMPGKWLLTRMAEYLLRKKIPDLNSGMRLIRRDVALKYMHLCPQGFSFSTTITMALESRGHRVTYIPIQVHQRVGKSTVSVRTGIETIVLMIRLSALFNPLRIFLPAAFGFITLGLLWSIPYVLQREGVTVGSMLSIVTGLVIFAVGVLCDQISQMRLERYE
ncbi:MAG: glycosyl transferase [Lysobacteraceae bacterium]|nr:MAG: glycosyl transferase [Xanthomonadaceae bacterium]